MIGAAAITVVGSALSSNNSNSGGSSSSGSASSGSQAAYDPYAPYRGAAATKLNALMADPSSVQQLPEYKADMQAASRTMAAQGYTGSGNALVASANAGGQAYQQAFNNLAMLAGAGQSPAYAAGLAANQGNYNQQAQNQMWGQIGNIAGGVIGNLHKTGTTGGGYYNAPVEQAGGTGYGNGGTVALGYNAYSI